MREESVGTRVEAMELEGNRCIQSRSLDRFGRFFLWNDLGRESILG